MSLSMPGSRRVKLGAERARATRGPDGYSLTSGTTKDHPGSTGASLQHSGAETPGSLPAIVHVSSANAEVTDCREFEGRRLEVEADRHAEKIDFQPLAGGDEQ